MNKLKKVCWTALLILVVLCGCSSKAVVVNDYIADNLAERNYKELYITYPRNWVALENDEDDALYFYFDNGLFSIYCRDLNTDVDEINPQERPILTKGYKDKQDITYGEYTWETQNYNVDGTNGFLATIEFNESKYFVFSSMLNEYDMKNDFSQIIQNIYFKEDLSMFQDGEFEADISYPQVAYDDIQTGQYANKIVEIEAVVGKYNNYESETVDSIINRTKGKTNEAVMERTARFDAWFKTEKGYVCKEDFRINDGEWTERIWKQLEQIDDGDKVVLWFSLDKYGHIANDSLIWIELKDKSLLEDYNIFYEEVENVESPPAEDLYNYVYIRKIGTKYHRKHCHVLKDEGIKVLRTEAIERGLTPCTMCDPLP